MSFPRLSLPAIVLLTSTVNFAIIFALFLLVLLVAGRFPGWAVLGFVPLLALQQTFALGLGFLLGALNVFYRDVAHGVGVALQFWFWFTPIVYSISVLPDAAQALFRLNPMTALVDAYQGIVLRGAWPEWSRFRLHAVGAVVGSCSHSPSAVRVQTLSRRRARPMRTAVTCRARPGPG